MDGGSMEDEFLFRIALITSIIGLLGMIFFANEITPREVKIKDITRGMLDEDVSLEGVVENVKQSSKGNTYFLEVADGTGRVTMIIFDGTATNLQKVNISINSLYKRKVQFTGKVTEYQGQLEVVIKDASSVKIVA
jgi:DNA/RNA endonuclease YhcR with UshA esterase domain